MVERVRRLPSILGIAVSLAACGGDDNSLLRRPVLGTGGQDAGSPEAGGGGSAGRGGAGSGGRGSGGVTAQPPCQNSLDCTGSGPRAICDQATRLCVECVQTADCEARHDCLNNTCVAYTTCVNSLGCPNGQICDTARGRCFECVSSGDCAADSSCVANRCLKKCVSDRTCTPLGLLCDTAAGVCVQCLVDSDCGANQNCNAGTCANRAVGAGGVGNGGQAGAGGFGGAGGVSSGGPGGGSSTGGAGGSPTVTKHILLVADASGSMIENGGTAVPKWTELMNGVNAFTADPASATVTAAFQIFPQVNAPCDGTTYVTPLVAMGPLGPGTQTAQAITTQMSNHSPGFGGAIQSDVEGALRGATAFCANHRTASGEDCTVVFVTDGNPTLCSADTTVLAQIAGSALADSGVRTWIVALLGVDFGQFDEIARQGGTDCDTTGPGYACNASGASPTVQALLAYVRDHLGN